MKKRIIALTVLSVPFLMAASCPPRPPNPVPTPTPGPTPIPTPDPGAALYLDTLLRQPNPPHLTKGDAPHNPTGAIQCCQATDPEANARLKAAGKIVPPPKPLKMVIESKILKVAKAEINTRWPLASESWMNFANTRGGADTFHFRMGPFYGGPDHESEWSDIGGPYSGGPGSDWNPSFWMEYQKLLDHAGRNKWNVQVNVIDTWYCKHAQWGDQPMPWPTADIEACGRRPSPEQERYIRKVVSEAQGRANVFWITGNESGEISGATRAWHEWVHSVIRDEEQKHPAKVVRLVGVDDERWAGSPFDYTSTHAKTPLTSAFAGAHSENNERNPVGAPEVEYSNYCQAQQRGLHWWLWRGDWTMAQLNQAFSLWKQKCGTVSTCAAPDAYDPLWGENVVGPTDRRPQVEAAKAEYGERCGTIPPHDGAFPTLAGVAEGLRRQGVCATGPWGDAVAAQEGSDPRKFSEWHVVRFTDGCWAENPEVLPKFIWTYNGTPPAPPSSACGEPQPPPLTKWNLKEHTRGPNWVYFDSTPLVCDRAYCAAIGFTDGRSCCSLRQEGAPDRRACEDLRVGVPQWTGLGEVSPTNPYQYRVRPGVTGPITVCTSVLPQVCETLQVIQ